jgi:hypothetical protein
MNRSEDGGNESKRSDYPRIQKSKRIICEMFTLQIKSSGLVLNCIVD